MEEANLVVTVRRGREKLHYLTPVPVQEIADRLGYGAPLTIRTSRSTAPASFAFAAW